MPSKRLLTDPLANEALEKPLREVNIYWYAESYWPVSNFYWYTHSYTIIIYHPVYLIVPWYILDWVIESSTAVVSPQAYTLWNSHLYYAHEFSYMGKYMSRAMSVDIKLFIQNENCQWASTSEQFVQDMHRPDRCTPRRVLVDKTLNLCLLRLSGVNTSR